MEAKLYGQNKGGTSINGIIKDYYAYAGENISAGDLVEYVNGVAGKATETSEDEILSEETRSGYTISAVQLDNNRIFIAHSYGSTFHLYGMVVTIDGVNITYGEDTVLCSTDNSGKKISAVALDESRVLVLHNYNPSSDYLYGIVCTISGSEITKGKVNSIVYAKYGLGSVSACLLSTDKVFIAYSYNDDYYYLTSIVCTISGDTITAGSAKELSSTDYSGEGISVCLLDSSKVFIAHSYNSSKYLYGIVCTISGTTISKGSDTSLVSTTNAGSNSSITKLADNRLLIVHKKYVSSTHHLYGIVVTISGTTISKGTDTALVTTNPIPGTNISTCLLPNGNVFIAHCYTTNYYLTALIVKVEGTTITPYTHTTLNAAGDTGWTTACILLNNGNMFLAHGNYKLYAQIWGIDYENNVPTNQISITETETQVRKVTTGQFDGVAKTSGTGGDDTGHKDLVSIWTKEGE